jgi:4,5-DOPA dioxygenase extradiol
MAAWLSAADHATSALVDGYEYGSLSMTSYTLGLDCPQTVQTGGAAPLPENVPADNTNI